jgi:histone H3/H4
MYGYGLEGYGYAGEGFRYPHIEGYYEEPVTIATVQKEGPRKGKEIKRYLPKVDDRWIAAYLLNKRLAAKNRWRKYATEALQKASEQYLADLQKENREAYERAIEEKKKRQARKGRIPLLLRSPEAKELLKSMEVLDDRALLAHYYLGRKPGKIPKKVRTTYPTLLEQIRELSVKNREHGAGSPAHSTSSKNRNLRKNSIRNSDGYTLHHRTQRIKTC